MHSFFEHSSPLGIAAKLQENLDRLGVPRTRLEDFRALRVVVNRFLMIRVGPKVYSISSWLIGETVEVRVYSKRLKVRYADEAMTTIDRLRGRG